MMDHLKVLAMAAALAIPGSSAFAVTTTPFASPLSAGDSTLGNTVASAFEDFSFTTLSFTAATDLVADTSITINPFLTDVTGSPTNSIGLSYSINGASAIALPIVNVLTIGASELRGLVMDAGDTLSYFVTGTAGRSGNQVTFAVETSPVAPIPLPAGALLMLTALGGMAVVRRKSTV